MSSDPTLYGVQSPQALESVTVEVDHLPDGRECYNVRGQALQGPAGQEWERVVALLLAGLRAALTQTVQPQVETSRIVAPGGLTVPLTGQPRGGV
jgi:hypothetical protein